MSPTASSATATPTTPEPTALDPDDLAAAAPWTSRAVNGMGAFAAAGVIALLAAQRRRQLLRRAPGQRLSISDDPRTWATERSLRAVADESGVHTVDLVLRTLAQQCHDRGESLPVIRALRVGERDVELFLQDAAALPKPWRIADDGLANRMLAMGVEVLDAAEAISGGGHVRESTHWVISPDEVHLIAAGTLADIPAPFPALLTVGHDLSGAHVMLDLEYVGALGVHGDEVESRAVLAAMIVELATSSWADDVQITVVGDFAGLDDTLATGRVRYLPSVSRAAQELQHQSAQDSRALAQAGVERIGTARVRGVAPQTWTPAILVIATPITSAEREALREALNHRPGPAVAVITSDEQLATWALTLNPGDEPAELVPLGVQLYPQILDEATYGDVLRLADIAGQDPAAAGYVSPVREPRLTDLTPSVRRTGEGDVIVSFPHAAPLANDDLAVRHDSRDTGAAPLTDLPESVSESLPDPLCDPGFAASHVQLTPEQAPAPVVRVLGPVRIDGARGTVEASKRARLSELIAYLALHPGAGHVEIDEALWPGRRHEDNLNTRNTATSKARAWLGRSDDGSDYLPRHAAGQGYRLSEQVTSDWAIWQQLIGSTVFLATTEQLSQALALVQGRPFEGVHPRRYAWADALRQQMTVHIVDAAYELARRKLSAGDWRAAEAAALQGLDVEPAWEPLWRLRIMAAHESGNAATVNDVISRMLSITDAVGSDLEPETLALLEQIKASRSGPSLV